MSLTLITAISENNVIGNNGKLPWSIPEDLKRFQILTKNHPVIMGRKTYESIPEEKRPLKQRKNIVLTKNSDFNSDGIYIAKNIEEAIDLCEGKEGYVIGGESVYREFLPYTNKMELTKIHREFEGDTYFPEINWNEWEKIMEMDRFSLGFSFTTYRRRK